MSSLGLMGAIGGIGKSMSQYADTTTKDHLEQMKENRLREYQNGVRAEERSYQEGIRAEERGYQEERDKLNREHEKGLLSMRLSGKADASPPKLQKGFNPDTGKVGFFYLNESKQPVFVEGVEAPPTSSDSDPTQESFDPDAFVEKYQQAKGDQSSGVQASSEKKTLASQYQNKADLLETEKTSGKQIEYYDSQLSNIETRVGELSNLSLPDNDGLFEVNSAGSGDQNAKKHFMRMLEDIYKNGSPEQQEKAHSLYRQLMGA